MQVVALSPVGSHFLVVPVGAAGAVDSLHPYHCVLLSHFMITLSVPVQVNSAFSGFHLPVVPSHLDVVDSPPYGQVYLTSVLGFAGSVTVVGLCSVFVGAVGAAVSHSRMNLNDV